MDIFPVVAVGAGFALPSCPRRVSRHLRQNRPMLVGVPSCGRRIANRERPVMQDSPPATLAAPRSVCVTRAISPAWGCLPTQESVAHALAGFLSKRGLRTLLRRGRRAILSLGLGSIGDWRFTPNK